MSITTIGDSAFACSGISSIKLADGITSIGNDAFSSSKLESITLPESLKTIGEGAFSGTLLKSIIIPEAVEKIGKQFLYVTNKLETVLFEENSHLMDMAEPAIYMCDALSSITIPASIAETVLPCVADNGTLDPVTRKNSLISIIVTGNMNAATLVSVNKSIKNHAQYYWVFDLSQTKGLTTIPDEAFIENACSLIILPSSILTIGKKAFYDCNIRTIAIPSSVTAIDDDAFKSCRYLKSVIIYGTNITMGELVFSWCSELTSIKCACPSNMADSWPVSWCYTFDDSKKAETTTITWNYQD